MKISRKIGRKQKTLIQSKKVLLFMMVKTGVAQDTEVY